MRGGEKEKEREKERETERMEDVCVERKKDKLGRIREWEGETEKKRERYNNKERDVKMNGVEHRNRKIGKE